MSYSKTCLQGTPLYPRESVPTWHVSLHRRFLNMGKIGHRSDKVSPDHRVSPHRSVPWRQVLLYKEKIVYTTDIVNSSNTTFTHTIYIGNITYCLICIKICNNSPWTSFTVSTFTCWIAWSLENCNKINKSSASIVQKLISKLVNSPCSVQHLQRAHSILNDPRLRKIHIS